MQLHLQDNEDDEAERDFRLRLLPSGRNRAAQPRVFNWARLTPNGTKESPAPLQINLKGQSGADSAQSNILTVGHVSSSTAKNVTPAPPRDEAGDLIANIKSMDGPQWQIDPQSSRSQRRKARVRREKPAFMC